MTPQIRSDQASAMGGCAPCQPATKPGAPGNTSSTDKPLTQSVLVVDPDKQAWIGIVLVDTKKRPVAHAAFVVTPPNHEPVRGTLDAMGRARVEGVDPGTCKIEFPQLHKKEFV